jgi:hypothetical protein
MSEVSILDKGRPDPATTDGAREAALAIEEAENIARAIYLRPLPESFDIHAAMIPLKQRDGSFKDYLPVMYRLVWFREVCPFGTIDTEELEFDLDREIEVDTYEWNDETRRREKGSKKAKGYARYRAVVEDGFGGRATGTKDESAASFPVDFGPKAETGAIGRALAALGFGTQFAIELSEDDRIVDAPVDRSPTSRPSGRRASRYGRSGASRGAGTAATANGAPKMMIETQKATIRRLCSTLKIDEPDFSTMSYVSAAETLQRLSGQLREKQATARTKEAAARPATL